MSDDAVCEACLELRDATSVYADPVEPRYRCASHLTNKELAEELYDKVMSDASMGGRGWYLLEETCRRLRQLDKDDANSMTLHQAGGFSFIAVIRGVARDAVENSKFSDNKSVLVELCRLEFVAKQALDSNEEAMAEAALDALEGRPMTSRPLVFRTASRSEIVEWLVSTRVMLQRRFNVTKTRESE